MKIVENWFRASDGQRVFFHEFLPDDNNIRFVVQIVHGLAEHSLRYEEFAKFLTDRNIAVYVNDHRGHGRTAYKNKDLYVWDFNNAWQVIVDDLKYLNNLAYKNNPEKNIYLIGHNIGVPLSIDFLTKYCSSVKGAILTGPLYINKIKLFQYFYISCLHCLFYGNKYKSKLLNNFIPGSYHKLYNSPYEWLSTEKKNIQKYIEDNFFGNDISTSLYKNLFSGIQNMNKISNLKKISKDLPLLILSGTEDPVSNFGKYVKTLEKKLINTGIKDVEYKLYSGARHELINEKDNINIFQDIYMWLNMKQENEGGEAS